MSARRAIAAALLLAAGPAGAHVRLVTPTSRYGDEMKVGPCGRLAGTRSANVTTVAPGQALRIIFDELIDHPGYFRIAFDPAGDGALAPPTTVDNGLTWSNPPGVMVLADHIPDAATGLTHGVVDVTLPDLECSTCTLQLIQVMTDKPPFDGLDDFYYQCADLVLTSTPGAASPPSAPPAMPSGGCDSPGSDGGLLGLLLLAALALTRRGRGRPLGRR